MGEFAALGSAFLWALTTVFMRFGSARMDLYWLNALRCLFGVLVMGALLLLIPGGIAGLLSLPPAVFLWLLVSTLLANVVGDTLYFRSSQLIGVSRAMPLSGWHPLVTVVAAAGLLGEAISWRLGAGTALILGGVYLVGVPRGRATGSPEGFSARSVRTGMALAGLTAICWGLSVIGLRVALQDPAIDPLVANLVRMSQTTFFLLAFAWVRTGSLCWRKVDPRFLALLALMGAVGAAGSPFLWLYAVQHAGAAKAAVLSSTSPLFGLLLSIPLLSERLDRRTVVGTVLTTLGVWLIL